MPLSTILRGSAFLFPLIAAILAGPAHSAPLNSCSVKPSSPLVVNVRDEGAKGDGKTDDTAAIQRAIDAVGGAGGTVYVPDGIYMVVGVDAEQLQLRSNMTLKLSGHAILKVIPNGAEHYSVLRINQVSDVAIVGGILQGDRAKHKGKKGEWGMGISIGPNAQRVTVVGVTAKDMWGDGFYVIRATDVAFCSVVADHNRRQGLSIIDTDRLLVTNSVFRDTHGTRPSAGIDIEPDKPDQRVSNVIIEKSKFVDNAGGGIMIAGKKGEVANVRITQNVFEGTRPILVENAPRVHSTQICKNRYIAKELPTSEGFNTFSEPVNVVALQANCSEGRDMRFETNRFTKKKKK
jgi:polygalacturonase